MNTVGESASWTVEQLLDLVPKEDILTFDNVKVASGEALYGFASKENPMWFRQAAQSLRGDRGELLSRLGLAMQHLSSPLHRVHVATVLVGLGDAAGIQVFLDTLSGGEEKAQEYAAAALAGIWSACRLPQGGGLDVPLTASEVIKALRPLLEQPTKPAGESALRFCLQETFAESELWTQPLLTHAAPQVRVLVAEAYLQRQRDAGALRVAVGFLCGPAPSPERRDEWKTIAGRYTAAMLACARAAAEPLKSQVGRTALSVLRTALTDADLAARIGLASDGVDSTAADGGTLETLLQTAHEALGKTADETLLALARNKQRTLVARACLMVVLAEAAPQQEALDLAMELVNSRQEWPRARAAWLARLCPRLQAEAIAPVAKGLRDCELREHLLDTARALPRGPQTVPLIAALREALADEYGWRAQAVALVLFELGDHGEAVIAALKPAQRWEWQWQKSGIDARQVLAALADTGAIDPAAVAGDASSARQLLLRLLQPLFPLPAGARPDYAALFRLLLNQLPFAVPLELLEVSWHKGVAIASHGDPLARAEPRKRLSWAEKPSPELEGLVCTLRYAHQGWERKALISPGSAWSGIEAVLEAFDDLMFELHRDERAFRLDLGGTTAVLTVAREEPFLAAAAELQLPLMQRPRRESALRLYPPDAFQQKSAAGLQYGDGTPVEAGDAVLFDGGLYPARVLQFVTVPGAAEQLLLDIGEGGRRLMSAAELAQSVVFVQRHSIDYAIDAVSWLRERADSVPAACHALGNLAMQGKFLPADPEIGLKLWQGAVAQQDPRTPHQLGLLYQAGKHGLPKDPVKAAACQRSSAEQGCARGQHYYGLHLSAGLGVDKNPAEAVTWYRNAAEQGDAAAQFNLALTLSRGQGMTADPAEAAGWFERAAVSGSAQAQYQLGLCYHSGSGVKQDHEQALRWLLLAAGQEHPAALALLGEKYERGLGVARDLPRAIDLYRTACDKGDAAAMYRLGRLYYLGRGFLCDYSAALHWLEQASTRGYDTAAQAITLVRKSMAEAAAQAATQAAANAAASPSPAQPPLTQTLTMGAAPAQAPAPAETPEPAGERRFRWKLPLGKS